MKIRTAVLLAAFVWTGCGRQTVDLLIRGGEVADGTGKQTRVMDVGIRDGRIVALGNLGSVAADTVLDAAGRIVAPGFIDLHTHCDEGILEDPSAFNYLLQGVTTVLGGNCGQSNDSIGAFLDRVEEAGIGPNFATLVGHNTIRSRVMGSADRKAGPDDLEKMKALVVQAMEEGAVGLSTGLKYIPGAYADKSEIVELAKAAAERGGFYASHLRDEGLGLIEAVKEALSIGREAGIPVQISHHKVVGKSMWGSSAETLRLIEDAVQEGVDVLFDQYPYTATYTGLTVLFPAWSLSGGQDSLLLRLRDSAIRPRIKAGIVHSIQEDRGGGDPACITVANLPGNPKLEGLSLAEITTRYGMRPTPENAAETVLELQKRGGGSAIYHCLSDEDLERILVHTRGIVASDGEVVLYKDGVVHPRNYGTFPRVLGVYVRERGLLGLEQAIRKMTSIPARRLGLKDRGVIRKGFAADVVIFDPDRIEDNATYLKPHQKPSGIFYVIVNGTIAVDQGTITDARPGLVLRGPGFLEKIKTDSGTSR